MTLYLLYGIDGPDGAEIRKTTRASHLAWIETLAPRVKIGGPMYAEDGVTPVGSMIVLEAASLDEARATFAQDPYALAGLWARSDIRPYNWLVRQ